MCLIMVTGIFAGCSREPGDEETAKRLEERFGGERFEVSGRTAHSLDRELDFEVWYDKDGTAIWPDIKITLGGDYILYSSYDSAVHGYWIDEYRKCIDGQNFKQVDYGKDGEDKANCTSNLVYVFVEEGASEEDIKKVESLLTGLRDICRKEAGYHDPDYKGSYSYLAYIWYIDSAAGIFRKTDGVKIYADTKDSDLQLGNVKIKSENSTDPRKTPLSNGNAMIFVN